MISDLDSFPFLGPDVITRNTGRSDISLRRFTAAILLAKRIAATRERMATVAHTVESRQIPLLFQKRTADTADATVSTANAMSRSSDLFGDLILIVVVRMCQRLQGGDLVIVAHVHDLDSGGVASGHTDVRDLDADDLTLLAGHHQLVG